MPLHVYRSNRMEALADVLAAVVSQPSEPITTAECIVVQGRGMERWLAQELARRLGVWANPDFPFPRRLVDRVLTAVLEEPCTETDAYQPEAMRWRIAALLPLHEAQPPFAPIRAYLAADRSARRRLQLAERIADTFDQYVVYRPDLVLAWEQGREAHWQAILWRALVAQQGPRHAAARARDFLQRAHAGFDSLTALPPRVSLFGISALPPLYVQVLAALAQAIDVHLFVLSPSREYWGEIRSRRELLRSLAVSDAGAAATATARHLAEGNPLLASLGRLGRDFQQLLETSADYVEDDGSLYVDAGTSTMLATVQSDILALRQRGAGGDVEPLRLESGDDSISIHSCHGPMREVEVLHDQLRALFEADPTLEPHDVLVMTPAIDSYAPFIDAVFGAKSGDEHIPYRIADRRPRATEGVTDTFFRLLDVLGGRLGAPAVLDLLSLAPIRGRFGVTAEDIDLVRQWITEVGIRWGADAAHREAVGQPPLPENTWRFGLDRLLLGYAMPGEEQHMFGGVLPYDGVEGQAADLLGRVAEFCRLLFTHHEAAQAERTVAQWRDVLGQVLTDMVLSADETSYQHQQMRSTLDTLAARAHQAGFDEPVDLDAVRTQLSDELQRRGAARGFLSGGVTFCALVPMRSIPARVVCLLGMNDADFPRATRPPGFDLMAQHPRPGDRSPRDDDRYLFLEAVLAARDRLLITYVGQSIRDGSEMPPSVVVDELLDALETSFRFAAASERASPATRAASGKLQGASSSRASSQENKNLAVPGSGTGGDVRERVRVRHRLQAVSPWYFGASADRRLFSYSVSNCEAARRLVEPRQKRQPFLPRPLPLSEDAPRAVSIDQLVRFLERPARFFLRQRLLLWLGADAEPLQEREPVQLNTLERWFIGDLLLRRAVTGEDIGAAFEPIRAMGVLPPGALGRSVYAELQPYVEMLAMRARDLMAAVPRDPLEIDRHLDGTRITGVLRDLWNVGQVRVQYSKLGRYQEIGLWVRHLLLCWAAPRKDGHDSFLVGRAADAKSGPVVHWRRVENAEPILRQLLQLYWEGQQRAVPFFPSTSRLYVETLRKQSGETDLVQALETACASYDSEHPFPGEGRDAYLRQIFGSSDLRQVLDEMENGREEFQRLACLVFDPLLAHRELLA